MSASRLERREGRAGSPVVGGRGRGQHVGSSTVRGAGGLQRGRGDSVSLDLTVGGAHRGVQERYGGSSTNKSLSRGRRSGERGDHTSHRRGVHNHPAVVSL